MRELPYTALITPAALQGRALDSLALNLSTDSNGDPVDPEGWEAAVLAIEDAGGALQDALGRSQLIARKVEEYFPARLWQPGVKPGRYYVWTGAWPAFEVEDTAEVDYSVEAARGADASLRRLFAPVRSDAEVTYYAGYRRKDQTLEDVQAEVPGVTKEPPVLPAAIRAACVELVLHRLFQAENKQYGTGQTRQNIGGQNVTVSSTDTEFTRRTLKRLHSHKKLSL